MYGRLIEFSGADPEKREKAIETINETVIPMLKGFDGYAGYIHLTDALHAWCEERTGGPATA